MRAALLLAAVLCCGAASATSQPEASHMQAYRQRLALYLSMGQGPEQVVTSMANYFPWFGARFGVETQRDGAPRYYVAIGSGTSITFYALLN